MSGDWINRREFVEGLVAVSGAFVLTAKGQSAFGAAASRPPQLLLFDSASAQVCRYVESEAQYSCVTQPVTGDRVRFANELFASGQAPDVVAGVTHYADYILLTGCAAEQGYRVRDLKVEGSLATWKIERARRTISS